MTRRVWLGPFLSVLAGLFLVLFLIQYAALAQTAQNAPPPVIPWEDGPTVGRLGTIAEITVPQGYRFTGQAGAYGRLDPATGKVDVFDAPQGRGPYGITATPDGEVYYASLAGSHIARVDTETGAATVLRPPTAGQGARRVWSDSKGRIWVSEWDAGQVAVYDPKSDTWREWKLPGARPQAYAVFVDDRDVVWLSDFGANAMVRFDPATEQFRSLPLPSANGQVRQILGRPGEVWGAESGADRLVLIRTR